MFVCKVAIPRLPLLLDYLPIPGTEREDYPFGTRVQVPYRRTVVIGYIVKTTVSLAVSYEKARLINNIIEYQYSLCHLEGFYHRFCNYYSVQMSELLDLALPKYLLHKTTAPSMSNYQVNQGLLLKPSDLTKAGWRLYDWLASQIEPCSLPSIIEQGFRQSTIQQCLSKKAIEETRLFKYVVKGFLLNIINISYLVIWAGVIVWFGPKVEMSPVKIWTFFFVSVATYLAINVLKFLLSSRLKSKLTDFVLFYIRQGLNILILIFGIVLIFKGA